MHRYTELLKKELRSRAKSFLPATVQSIYFGGGTPSLLPAEDILSLCAEVKKLGFHVALDAEVTIEINPGTIDNKKLDLYRAAGVNRFSVGVQTFNDKFLKFSGREHSADVSRSTLRFLKASDLNFSFDLLFGLPNQTLKDLELDLKELCDFNPNHVSLYNLTVPNKHFMNMNRASDETQIEMFDLIDTYLLDKDVRRYELSNYARPGYESTHNTIYWTDRPYWGLGVSAHSYLPGTGEWGTRFRNPSSHKQYVASIEGAPKSNNPFFKDFAPQLVEELALNESLTDFCHTQLRLIKGLDEGILRFKYGSDIFQQAKVRLLHLTQKGLLLYENGYFRLSPTGLPLSNQVFLELTFLPNELYISTR